MWLVSVGDRTFRLVSHLFVNEIKDSHGAMMIAKDRSAIKVEEIMAYLLNLCLSPSSLYLPQLPGCRDLSVCSLAQGLSRRTAGMWWGSQGTRQTAAGE